MAGRLPKKLYYVLAGKTGIGGGKYTNFPDALRKATSIKGRLFVAETEWKEIPVEETS